VITIPSVFAPGPIRSQEQKFHWTQGSIETSLIGAKWPRNEKNHIPNMVCIFLTVGAYAPHATCMATRLAMDMKLFIHIHINIHRFSVDIHGYIHIHRCPSHTGLHVGLCTEYLQSADGFYYHTILTIATSISTLWK